MTDTQTDRSGLSKVYPIWFKWYQQADLPIGCLCKVAPEELYDWEHDDPEGDEHGEEDPVELVEEA